MIIDQHHAVGRMIAAMSRNMYFADRAAWEAPDPSPGIEPDIVSRDIDIVDVEQESAAGAANELGEKLCLVHGRLRKVDICREILDKDLSPERRLGQIDVVGKNRERFLIVRNRQQVIEIDTLADTPGEVLRHDRRLIAVADRLQAEEVISVDALCRSE